MSTEAAKYGTYFESNNGKEEGIAASAPSVGTGTRKQITKKLNTITTVPNVSVVGLTTYYSIVQLPPAKIGGEVFIKHIDSSNHILHVIPQDNESINDQNGNVNPNSSYFIAMIYKQAFWFKATETGDWRAVQI